MVPRFSKADGQFGAGLGLYRIGPPHTGEATEVDIGGTQFGAVLDSQSGQMRVAGQISRRAKRSKQTAKDDCVAIRGMYDRDTGLGQPSINDVEGLVDGQGPLKYRCARG